jgi:hypothetical protein
LKLRTVSRVLCAGATLGVVSTLAVLAGTIRHVGPLAQRYKVVFVGAQGGGDPNFTCPPSYFACVRPTRSSPFTAEWCPGSCSIIGADWAWTATVNKIGSGDSYERVHAMWYPNPGNPSTLTISDRRKRTKGTRLIASVTNSVCQISTGSCFSNFVVYGVTN